MQHWARPRVCPSVKKGARPFGATAVRTEFSVIWDGLSTTSGSALFAVHRGQTGMFLVDTVVHHYQDAIRFGPLDCFFVANAFLQP